jgi:hypothetical protein
MCCARSNSREVPFKFMYHLLRSGVRMLSVYSMDCMMALILWTRSMRLSKELSSDNRRKADINSSSSMFNYFIMMQQSAGFVFFFADLGYACEIVPQYHILGKNVVYPCNCPCNKALGKVSKTHNRVDSSTYEFQIQRGTRLEKQNQNYSWYNERVWPHRNLQCKVTITVKPGW